MWRKRADTISLVTVKLYLLNFPLFLRPWFHLFSGRMKTSWVPWSFLTMWSSWPHLEPRPSYTHQGFSPWCILRHSSLGCMDKAGPFCGDNPHVFKIQLGWDGESLQGEWNGSLCLDSIRLSKECVLEFTSSYSWKLTTKWIVASPQKLHWPITI